MNHSTKTRNAIGKYGYPNCLRAFIWNTVYGEGASTIALQMSCDDGFPVKIRRTLQADAAINAGRELSNNDAVQARALLDQYYSKKFHAEKEAAGK